MMNYYKRLHDSIFTSCKRTWREKATMVLFLVMFGVLGVRGQVTVSGALVGNGSYTTLGAAFTAINGGAQTASTISISITGNTTEVAAGATLNAGTWTSLTIAPSGGSWTVSGAATAGSPLVGFNGADNVTVNGGGNLTFSNTTVSATSGTSTLRLYADATNNTFNNLIVLGSASMAPGTNGGNVWISTGTTTGNDGNSFQSCKFGPAGTNLPSILFYGNGSTASTAIENSGVTINNCEFYDYFQAAVGSAAVYMSTGNTAWTVTNNKVYQTATRTITTSSTVYGIYMLNAGATALGENFTVTGNTIGYASNSGTGTMTYAAGTTAGGFVGINFSGSAASTGTNSISNNIVSDIQWTSTGASIFSGISSTGISSTTTGAVLNMNGNTVRNISQVTSTGALVGITSGYAPTTNINTNTISNITRTGSSTFYGIQYAGGATTNVTLNSNNISNLNFNNTTSTSNFYIVYSVSSPAVETFTNNTISSITSTSTGAQTVCGFFNNTAAGNKTIQNNSVSGISLPSTGTGIIYGIRKGFGGTTDNISGNTIFNLTGGATIYGLTNNAGTTNNIFNNKVYGLSSSVATATVYGFNITGGTTNNIYNNIIGSLTASAATGANAVVGINAGAGTTNNIYYNTVYLSGTSSGSGFGSSALSASTTPTLDLRNNILVNATTPTGAGLAVAYRRSSTTLTTYASTSNNNLFFGTTMYTDGTNTDATLSAFQTRVTPRDAVSRFQNPTFTSTTGADGTFLHFTAGAVNLAGGNGQVIAGYTTDFDGNTRDASTPDIGADEWANGTVSPPTVSSFTPTTLCVQGGQTVTITGTNLDTVTSVLFNGSTGVNLPGSIVSATATTLTVLAPANIVDGGIKVTNPAASYDTTGILAFTAAATPTVSVSPSSATICSGSSTSLTANGASTYTWSPATGLSSTTGASVTANPTTTTTYTVTGTSAAGCTGTATVTVTVNPTPTAVTVNKTPSSVCNGGVTTLVATGGTVGSSGNAILGSATTLTTANGTEPTAFNNRYKHYWMQMVYTPAELTAAGLSAGSSISAVKFNITTIGDGANVTDLKVRMGNAPSGTLSAFQSTGLTLVKTAATYTHAIGVNTLTFDTNYTWDGTSNLIFDLRSTGADITNNAITYYTATVGNTVATAVTSTASSSDGFAATNPTATLSVKRLNTTFTYSSVVSTTFAWTPTTGLYTDAGATTAYAGENLTTVYAKLPDTTPATFTASSTLGSCSSSGSVTVSPNALPTITSSGDVSICNGGSTTLTANGASTYTWSPSTGLSSATGSSVTANPTATTTYTITGTDANGCVGSTTLTVTVNEPVVITSQPSNAIVQENDNATFTLTATGTGLAYQWEENTGSGWSAISGANSASLTLSSVTNGMNGYQYRCIVSGTAPCASVTSDVKTLTVSSVSISAQPTNQTICSNGAATFTFTASGDTSYQWQISTNSGGSWSNISGETSHDLVLSGLNSSSTGYLYRCLINGGTGSGGVDTDSASLTVNDAVSIISQPSNQAVCSNGGSVAFSVSGIGTSVTYQWQVNTGSGWSNISGQTSASYSIATPTVAMNGYQYRAIVGGAAPCSSVTSDVATLNVYQAVSITTQPTAVSLCNASSTGFSVVANGSGLTYQWVANNGSDITLTDGADFSGTNSASLSVLNASAYNGYTFKVVVSGTAPCASVTSNGAALTILPIMNGVKTVGSGGDYATLTAAVAAYNASTCFTGNVVFNLTDATYSTSETFPITINSNANAGSYTLTIKPATTATITGSSASAIIKLNGADNVIIDGSNSGSTDKSLTIENTNTGTSSTVVWIGSITANGATNNTVKNIIAKGNGPATTLAAIMASSGTTAGNAAEAANTNLTIQDNTVMKAQYGIGVAGSATAQTGTVITNNIVGSNTSTEYIGFRGVFISNVTSAVVSRNTIFNIIVSSSTNVSGIEVAAGVTDASIVSNTIKDIVSSSSSGYGAYGINISSATSASGTLVANNMISGIKTANYSTSSTTWNAFGIRIAAAVPNLKIYNNTVNIYGSVTSGASAGMSAAFCTTVAATGLDVRNNIFRNVQTFGTSGSFAYNMYLTTGTTFTDINYNNYYGTSGTNTTYRLGYSGSAAVLDLAAWKTFTAKDAQSLAVAPNFTSDSDLHLNVGTNSALDNFGTPIASVTTDYDGDTRSATTPDMGADEFATLTCASQTLVGGTVASSISSFCATTSGATISANGFTIGVGTTYQWESATDLAFTTPTNVGSVLTNYANLSTGSLSATTYYRLKVICDGGSAVYSNVVGIIMNTPAVTTVSSNTTICAGGSATLTANGSSTYAWSPATGLSATTGATVTATPSATTTYTVTGTDANGCSTTATVTVTVNAYPSTVTATAGLSSLCVDSVTSLTATGGTVGGSGSATLGTATTLTGATSQPTAFCNRWSQYWGQTIYTAAELSAAGLSAGSSITSIAYNITTLGDSASNANYSIRIGNTSNSVFTAFQTTGLSTVYGPVTYTHAVGVNNITFTTPYVWDGTSNIIIDVRHDGIDSTNNAITYYTGAADNKTITAITSTTSATSTIQSMVAAATVTPVTSTQRLNVVLGYTSTVPTVMTWSPTTDLYTDAGASTAYTGGAATTVYVKPSTAGTVNYTATASNGSCTTSGSVSVEGLALPAFELTDVTTCQGTSVDLTVSSSEANTYAWSPSTGLSSTSGSSVTANPSVTTTYTVVATSVTNNCSKSRTVTVTVDNPPMVTSISPETNNVAVGQTSTFTVAATGTGITYQWQVNDGSGFVNVTNDSTYSGATTSVLTITNPVAEMSGFQYQCIVSGTAACTTPATSAAGTLSVDSTGITSQPVNATVCAGVDAEFTTTAASIDPEQVITYNWEIMRVGETEFSAITDGLDSLTGLDFSGSETGTLSMSGTTPANTGIQFRTIVNGYILSSSATLTVNAAVAITTQPSSASVCNGASVTFTAAASNATSYQWQVSTNSGASWTNVSGAVSTSLNLTASLADNGNQYRLVVNGASSCPSVNSDVATLSVVTPVITSQPVASTVLVNGTTSFSVVASPATSYQWEYATTAGGTYSSVADGTPAGITFSGANTATLTVNADLSVVASTANYLRCVVTNSSCTTTSSSAQLTVVTYCASNATNTGDEEIYNVTFNGASTEGSYANTNGCTTAAPGPGSLLSQYSNFTSLGSLTTVTRGQNVSFTVEQNECDGATYYSNGVAIWIDYNNDADFDDAGEKAFVENTTAAASATGSRIITGTIAIPATATLGTTRMRVIAAEGLSGTGLVPCGTYGYGETEDYSITIDPQPSCSGTPVAGTATISKSTICANGTVSVSVTGASSGELGLSYQWYSSTNGVDFSPISGANSIAFTSGALTVDTYYYLAVTCDNSSTTVNSNTVSVTVQDPQLTSTTGASRCGTGTVELSATANAGSSINWYAASTGGSSLGTGASFTTPSISTTTTYYAEAFTGSGSITGGRTAPTNIANTTPSSYGLVFDVTTAFSLNSVDVFNGTTSSGTFVIQLQNSAGTVLQTSSTFTAPAGTGVIGTTVPYTANLGWNVPVGTGYRLLITSGTASLVRESSLGGFPYTIGSVGSITSGYIGGTSTTYYYLYNWKVSAGCSSARTAVVATVTPQPTAAITYSGSPYCYGASATATLTGTNAYTGGTWSSTNVDMNAALAVANDGSFNTTLLPSSNVAVTYPVTYTIPAVGDCPAQPVTVNVVVKPGTYESNTADFSYSSSTVCTSGGIITPTLSNAYGIAGAFTASPSGLTLNGSTGAITLATSTPGTYTVTNTVTECSQSLVGTFTITVNQGPSITSQPVATTVCNGANASFTVAGSGSGVTYQWQVSTNAGTSYTDLSGETAATLSLTAVTNSMNGNLYRALVSDASGCGAALTSNGVALTVSQPAAPALSSSTYDICPDTAQLLTVTNPTYDLTGVPTILTLGTGTSLSTASTTAVGLGPNPFQSYYGGTRQQMLITAAELSALGITNGALIKSIAFNLSAAETTRTLQNYAVKMKNTSTTAFATSTFETGATTVRNAANYTPAVGWNTINFDSNFTYTGGNLIVEVTFSNADGGGSGTSRAYYSTTSYTSTLFYRVDSTSAATVAAATTASFSYSSRNNMQFGVAPATTTWSPTTGLYTDAAGTVAYTGTGTAQVYAKPTVNTTYTVTNSNSLGCTNSSTVVVNIVAPSTLSSITQPATTCAGSQTTFNLTGLIPSSTSTITYTVNGGSPVSVSGIVANGAGSASFTASLAAFTNGQTLAITSITRTDVTPNCATTITANNTVVISVQPIVTYYADADGDGFGNSAVSQVTCTGAPSGYVTNNTDCNDADPTKNATFSFYTDADGDTYGAGSLVSVCAVDSVTAPAGYSTNNTDCNDADATKNATYPFYADADGDSYGAGSLVSVCAVNSTTPPAGYVSNNTDCDDANAAIYQLATFYVDADADGYTNGTASVCSGTSAPAGYSATSAGTDCNDANPAVYQTAMLYVDADGDGYTVGAATSVCYGATIPTGYSATSAGEDCDDTNASITTGGTYYADADGDGFGNAAVSTTACTTPSGYVSNNTDCDDTNISIYQLATFYVDADGDGWDNGTASVCSGTSAPAGYSATTNGTDCNDNDAELTDNCAGGSVVNLTMFIQGYYMGGNTMNSVKFNQDFVSNMDEVEEITVELHDATTYDVVDTATGLLHTDGTLSVTFNTAAAGDYFIGVRGSNMVEIWSATAQTIGTTPLSYDFSADGAAYTDGSQASVVEVESGVFAAYSGDNNHDTVVDLSDYADVSTDSDNSAFGALATDLNGDGVVDLSDVALSTINSDASIYAQRPY